MANEFKHKTVGPELTQDEFEGILLHQFDSQAAGDLVYASSTEQLSRLPKGNDGEVLVMASGLPTWTSSGDPWTVVKLADDLVSSLAANTNVTNFYFTPAANKTYLIYGLFLLRTATATIGARPGISWPTGLTDATARVEASNSLTASAIATWGARNTQNAASTGLATTTNSHFGKLEAMLIVGASPSGNFQITLATETAGTNVTMKAGSFIMYREI